ncbi:penicillin-binding protein activator [Sphingobium boeckii]|uniref:ABC-type branched-subunit amino acid transport system substrate-binding protein n=1 Tax=Sphingobium boeckii TaxID=1082345 RepID=A0A7W9AK63_9SPHN|nr:penicillin-binding protein activator [Sphingobium boeckii]MBB5686986.1 ABC-type branched-subunit amino acid transport system substrate-binding protein [Sphingobium boeckii]
MAEAVLKLQPAREKSRQSIWTVAALSALMLASACQMVPKGKGPITTAPPPRDVVTPIGELPEDQQRHRIALLVPMTGADAGVGQSIANAANLAVLDTGGKAIRVTTYDTALGAAAAAQKAIADGNKLILGPLLAADATAIAPIARKAGVPLLSFSNDVSVAGNGTYVLGFTPVQSIERVVDYARSKGVDSFAALIPSGVYGQRTSTAFLRAVESSGGRVVSMQNYDRSQKSINAAVTKLQQSGSYDALMIADSGGVAIQAAPLVRQKGGAAARILGTELWNTEPRLLTAPALRGAWFASVSDTLYTQFATKYRARYARAPYRLASLGYDAVLLVVRVARDWKVGSAFPARQLSDSGGFGGVDGAFRFGKDGVAERMLEVQQVDAGKLTILSPAPGKFGQ